MREIELTQGKVALVDDKDYELLFNFSWAAHKEGNGYYYAVTSILQENGKYKQFRMHRMILSLTDPKMKVDHRSGNTLDNRKKNLRIASAAENARNINKKPFSKSGYRGVYLHKRKHGQVIAAGIKKDGKSIHLGFFETREAAAKAFDKAAKELFGKFCGKLNFK